MGPGRGSLKATGRSHQGVRRALRAAFAALGSRYVWGGTTPSSGLDCSGLTRWAWAQAGVALPHNSGAQRAALPAVRDELRPGDLLFLYSPISHVSLYVGRGLMIDAVTSRGRVVLQPVWWDLYVGAARPVTA
ncbi:MAG: C40 family peptidase [Actinobacteria bacterium]|nr:C40 family peptidase [Actinomycetota bacterium]